MKNHSVISKYKNPDRFIEKLKSQLEYDEIRENDLWEDIKKLKKELEDLRVLEKSKAWYDYEKGIEAGATFFPSDYNFSIIRDAKLHQKIIGTGEIVGLEHTFEKSGAKMLIKSIRIVPE